MKRIQGGVEITFGSGGRCGVERISAIRLTTLHLSSVKIHNDCVGEMSVKVLKKGEWGISESKNR